MPDPLRIALGHGRIFEKTKALFQRAGIDLSSIASDPRRLVHPIVIPGVREAEALLVRGSDVPAYVEHGVCALGIAGYDNIAEEQPNVLVPLDLKIAACRMAISARPEVDPFRLEAPRIATKYPGIASRFFFGRGTQAQIIELSGAIEIAPLVGLADAILDIVETGETLRKNGLVEKLSILDITARLIVNRAALKLRPADIQAVKKAIQNVLAQDAHRVPSNGGAKEGTKP